MAKRKFNPQVLQDMSPSGGLQPFDFMRPLDELAKKSASAPTTSVSDEQPKVARPRPARPRDQASETALPMPPSRRTEVRVQLNAKLPPELVDRLRDFALAHRVDIQDVVGYSQPQFEQA